MALRSMSAVLTLTLAMAMVLHLASAAVAEDCTTARPRENTKTGTWTTPRAAQQPTRWTAGRLFDQVVIVVFENHDYDEVMANATFRGLGERGVIHDRFLGPFHPSSPNYLALIGEQLFGPK